jgi:hypothetical protein
MRMDKDDAVPHSEQQPRPENTGPRSSSNIEDDGTGDVLDGRRPIQLNRRDVLGSTLRTLALGGLASAGLIGCASTARRAGRLPDPDLPTFGPTGGRTSLAFEPAVEKASGSSGTIVRARWAKSGPNQGGMNPQARLRYITIHHDGLPTPLASTGELESANRLESIRAAHRKRGWADIGYHYAVDRSGRIWDCRSLRYEGAHVKGHNPGNIGILVMGNFDKEKPTKLQLRSLCTQVNALCLTYGIRKGRVRTHREWASAATACPGRHLQPRVTELRARGFRA